ncbi:MAG: AMP-binding protein [Chitinophagales bacterium]|nr:AMP-binding protein [Chitinophagales bacterium]
MFNISFSSLTASEIREAANQKLALNNLSDWERDIWTFTEAFLNKKNNTFSVLTSGSTGKPKLIKLSRKQLEVSAAATINFFNLQKRNSTLLAIPASKIGGKMMIVRSALAQLNLSCVPLSANPFNGIKLNEKFDFAPLTPMQLFNGMSDVSTSKKVENLNTILLGGGEVSNLLFCKVQLLKASVFHSYGMTETASHIALRRLNGKNAQPYFETLSNISIALDERNCLQIEAPQFSKEVIATNDIVKILSPNQFEWIGRFDNTINSGGVKIQSEAVEAKLFNFLKFRFFIAGIKDEALGEKVIIAAERSPMNKSELSKFKALLEQKLSKYEYPKQVVFIHKFRETDTGKVQRSESLLHTVAKLDLK